MVSVMSRKDVKKFLKSINEYFESDFQSNDVFLKTEQNKIYIVTPEAWNFDLEKIHVKNIGIYFGQIMPSGEVRLSVEGSQLVGKTAKKIFTVNKEQLDMISHSEKFETDVKNNGFFIVKYKEHVIGCVKVSNGFVYNYIPKSRRNYE